MDVQDQTTHTPPSGHESHGARLCHRCGWAFPNSHPSAKHRRAHKKICGTIDGYTILIRDDDKEKTPSPKIEEKMSIRGSFSRSEDELFSDAVAEFSDSGTSTGSASKTLDRDLFFSFKDAENDGTNEWLNAPIEISKLDASVKVSEKIDTHVGKFGETEITVRDSSESNLELIDTGLIKDGVVGPAPKPGQTFETITKESKDSEWTKTDPDDYAIVGGDHDNVKQGNFERTEVPIADGINEEINQDVKSDCEDVSEVANEDETVKDTRIEKFESDNETALKVVKEFETDHLEGVAEEIKHENFESDHKHAPEVAKESAAVQNVTILIQKEDFCAPNVVSTEKEDLGETHLEKQLNKHTREAVENPVSVLTEKEDLDVFELEKSSKEQIQEVVKQPDTVLTEKEDLGGPHLEEQLNKHNHEVVDKPNSVLTKSQDLGAPELGKWSKDEVIEEKVDNDNVSVETRIQEFSSDNSVVNGKNASDSVHVDMIDGGKMNNQDSGAALSVGSSTRSSLEGNWGSVSVLSTASIDAGTLQSTEKSKVNSRKSNVAASDVLEPQSFTTLVEPVSNDKKPESSDVTDSQKQPNFEVSEAGRKRNEELIAKVTNWSTGTPLKNLLGEAKSPSGTKPEPVVQKDETLVNPLVNDGVSSPRKLIDADDDKKGRKKVKGLSSWVPFVCCSSVNVVN